VPRNLAAKSRLSFRSGSSAKYSIQESWRLSNMLLAALARALGLVSPGCPEAAIWARFSSTALLRERLRAYWKEAMKRATIRWVRGELVAQAVWMACSSKLGNTS
jgi:hypothetical protein